MLIEFVVCFTTILISFVMVASLSSRVFYAIRLHCSWYGASLYHTHNILSKIWRLLYI